MVTMLKKLLGDFPSNDSPPLPSPEISALSLHTNKNTQTDGKPKGPPPGFQLKLNIPNVDISTQLPSDSPTPTDSPTPDSPMPELPTSTDSPAHSSSNHTQQSMSAEEQQQIFINNYYMFDPVKLLLQQQYLAHNVYLPNPSNMPLAGPPLYHSQQNLLQQSLAYNSFARPPNQYNPNPNIYGQQEYRNQPPVPNNYFGNRTVPVNVQVPLLMNHPASTNYVLMNTPIPAYQFYQPTPPNQGGNVSSAVKDHRGEIASGSHCFQIVRPPPPSVPARSAPAIPKSASSPGPAYTPITVPEWPIKNLPVSYTQPPTRTNSVSCSHHSVQASIIKSEPLQGNQIPRPCTPLTPASAEVANICKQSRPNSSASRNSQNSGTPSSNSQVNRSPHNHSTINSQIDINPLDNAISDSQCESTEHGDCREISELFSGQNNGYRPESEVNKIPLPADLSVKEIPLPPSSPEKLYSAISSPVDSLVRTSPKEESSDDYASASENIEEAKRQLSNLTLTEQNSMPPLKSPCETNEDIPDSWENLELDETPAKAANFAVDFSQTLDLVIKNMDCESTLKTINPVEKSVESDVKTEALLPLKIHVPVNWKDTFNPDNLSSSERINNNNKVEEKPPSPVKFDVKKIPLQILKIQGKSFHLLYVHNKPAVIALEFFKQFAPDNAPAVSEKVVEVSDSKKFFYISRAEYPAILAELDKLTVFHGGVPKKLVIRLNKLRLLNLSETPQCLRILNVPYKPLLDDLKRLATEFESC